MITGPRDTVKRARKLRSEMTLPERKLWIELRKRPGGFKFRRQHPAGQYVLDFYRASVKLAIEVDGTVHDNAPAVQRDQRRSRWLRSQSIATTRVPARHIFQDMEAVILRILEICAERKKQCPSKNDVPLHHPVDGSPPQIGEE
ncbi:endonuclease domain-containing protein [Pontixanthobacter aestiaquae]|uniref:DUF559 domain-containing protein n=1 Tax=Pontixanthobacter aestiaquae TaxID=1509367 RepID=A0A844Z748_9SPHN|nr:endonuclease domain-containing protein [Pontixanthobacter aestiaquae]MDN3645263.1 endonuclease domain-containing protein [Pontixanthobacter aestiaquae]MXO83735.1 DUF559 domain-containing protein [Pontixanthobacter aestiaquae]